MNPEKEKLQNEMDPIKGVLLCIYLDFREKRKRER
jgi:hypothetical protein